MIRALGAIWCAGIVLASAPAMTGAAGASPQPPAAPGETLEGVEPEEIIGAEVRNLDDEHLGTVSDIVLDPEDGGPAVVIVAHGGVLGLGEREGAVPWRLLRRAPGPDAVLLDASEEALAGAPEPDADLLVIPQMFEEHLKVVEDYWGGQ